MYDTAELSDAIMFLGTVITCVELGQFILNEDMYHVNAGTHLIVLTLFTSLSFLYIAYALTIKEFLRSYEKLAYACIQFIAVEV
jgi:hypothetical protein